MTNIASSKHTTENYPTWTQDRYTHLKQFFDNLELHIRGLEAQNKKKEEFGDLLTLLLMDKLWRSEMFSQRSQKDNLDYRWLPYSPQDKTTSYGTRQNQRNKLNDKIATPFDCGLLHRPNTKFKNTTQDWIRNEGLHRTKESGVFFLWIITSSQRLPKTSTLMIASK